jgi:hypothetical protein
MILTGGLYASHEFVVITVLCFVHFTLALIMLFLTFYISAAQQMEPVNDM